MQWDSALIPNPLGAARARGFVPETLGLAVARNRANVGRYNLHLVALRLYHSLKGCQIMPASRSIYSSRVLTPIYAVCAGSCLQIGLCLLQYICCLCRELSARGLCLPV